MYLLVVSMEWPGRSYSPVSTRAQQSVESRLSPEEHPSHSGPTFSIHSPSLGTGPSPNAASPRSYYHLRHYSALSRGEECSYFYHSTSQVNNKIQSHIFFSDSLLQLLQLLVCV